MRAVKEDTKMEKYEEKYSSPKEANVALAEYAKKGFQETRLYASGRCGKYMSPLTKEQKR